MISMHLESKKDFTPKVMVVGHEGRALMSEISSNLASENPHSIRCAA